MNCIAKLVGKERIILADTDTDKDGFERLHDDPALIGSSKIPTIVGLNKYKTPFKAWCEDTGRIEREQGDADLLWWGHQMEPHIGALAERRGIGKVQPVNAVIRSESLGWAIASPDFLVTTHDGHLELLEAKNTGWWATDYWGDDKAPDSAHVQVQWQLWVLGVIRYGRIAGLIGGDPRYFHCPRFESDKAIQESLIEAAIRYRACLATDTPPEVGAEDKEAICEAYPPTEGKTVALSAEAGALIKDRDEIAAKLSDTNANAQELKKLKDALEAKLALELGDAESGVFEGREVQKKLVQRKGYEVKPCEYWQVSIRNYKA